MGMANASLRLAAAIGGLGVLAAAAPAMSPQQAIAARQASLDMSVMTFAELKAAARDGKPMATQVYPATSLAKWAKVLPTLFPAGAGPEAGIPTHAKPLIWSDRAGFERRAADYAAAAERLRYLAAAGDADGFKAQIEVVSKACDACHDTYKQKDQPGA
jgi:cytochrome c556